LHWTVVPSRYRRIQYEYSDDCHYVNRHYINKYLYRYQLNVKHRQTQLLLLHVSVLKSLMIALLGPKRGASLEIQFSFTINL
jgi:hypothetical protein